MPALSKASLQTALTDFATANKTHVIVQRGDATGDIAHVAPVLACRPQYGVLVVDNATTGDTGLRNVANVYTDSFLLPPDQVFRIKDDTLDFSSITSANRYNGKQTFVGKQIELVQLTQSTKDTVAELNAGKKATIATALRGPDYVAKADAGQGVPNVEMKPITHLDDYAAFADGALRAFWARKGITFSALDRHHVVVWARNSPNHPELNSTPKSMDQIAGKTIGKGRKAVIAGDIEPAETEGQDNLKASVFLGKFWKDDDWKLGASRAAQIRLFYILRQHLGLTSHKLVHVGMRSGGLDMYAFAGEPVAYIIAKSKKGEDTRDARMKPVVEAVTKAPASLPFGRVPVGKEPSKGVGGALAESDLDAVMEKVDTMLG